MAYPDESDLTAEKINLSILEYEYSNTEDNLSIADFGIADVKIDNSKIKIEKLTTEKNLLELAEYQKYKQAIEKKERRKNARLNSFRISKGEKDYDKYGYY